MLTAVISRAIRLDPQLLIWIYADRTTASFFCIELTVVCNTQVLVFDVVNPITIQGLETRPTDSFALLVYSILALLLFSSGCPVLSCGCHAVSCAVLWYLDRPHSGTFWGAKILGRNYNYTVNNVSLTGRKIYNVYIKRALRSLAWPFVFTIL